MGGVSGWGTGLWVRCEVCFVGGGRGGTGAVDGYRLVRGAGQGGRGMWVGR